MGIFNSLRKWVGLGQPEPDPFADWGKPFLPQTPRPPSPRRTPGASGPYVWPGAEQGDRAGRTPSPYPRRTDRPEQATYPYPRQRVAGWNPVDGVRVEKRIQAVGPQELAQSVEQLPWWFRLASQQRRGEIYNAYATGLRSVKPETLGLERLLDARLTAATYGAINRGTKLCDPHALNALIADLSYLEYSGEPAEAWKFRRDARKYVAGRLSTFADRLRMLGDYPGSMAVLDATSKTGAMSLKDRTAQCRLLWASGDSGPTARLAYLQYLEAKRWAVDDEFDKTLQPFLAEELLIGEGTPADEANERLPFVLRAMAGGAPINTLPLSAGLAFLRTNNPGRAVPYLRQAHSNNGHDRGERAYFLATALFQVGEFQEATTAFDDAVGRGFPRSRVSAWQGLALAKSGSWEDAFRTFREAEASLGAEADAEFFVYWGRASFMTHAFEEAEVRFQQAIDKASSGAGRAADPGSAAVRDRVRACHGLAVCLTKTGRFDEAVRELESAIREQPAFAPGAHLLGCLLERRGEADRALKCFRTAVAASPDDLAYVTSMGFALDDAGEPAGLQHLERVIMRGRGGPEAARRLAFGYLGRGDRTNGRRWLHKLAELAPGDRVCALWLARDLASEATEAFNRGNYEDSISLWDRVAEVLPGDAVARRLAQALLCDAAARLRRPASAPEPLWDQVARSHNIDPSPESAYLHAFCLLMRGDYEAARANFEALELGGVRRPELRFLAVLAGYLGGNDAAAEELSRLEAIPGLADLDALLKFLQIHVAVARADFQRAAQQVEAWAQLPNCLQVAGVARERINEMVLTILEKANIRKVRIVKLLEELNQRHNGYWSAALVVARHHEVTQKKPADAKAEKIEACDREYVEALAGSPAEKKMLQAGHAELLRYAACAAVVRGDLSGARSLLDRLAAIPLCQDPYVQRLRALIDDRLAKPSHQKAWAFAFSDPSQAQAIWEEILRLNQEDEVALQHLAVLHWSSGYELVNEAAAIPAKQRADAQKKLSEGIEALALGFEHYRALYARPGYWDALRRKGQALNTNAKPFVESAFDAWRESILTERAGVFVRLALDLAQDFEENARQAMQKMRSCGARSAEIRALADSFAGRLLPPDPTNLPDFEKSMAEAERVLRIDSANFKALEFVVKACAYRFEEGESQTKPNWKAISDRIGAAGSRAESLEKFVAGIDKQDAKERVSRELAGFWEALGMAKSRAKSELLNQFNETRVDQRLRDARSCIQESNRAFDQGERLDPTMRAKLRVKQAREGNEHLLVQIKEYFS